MARPCSHVREVAWAATTSPRPARNSGHPGRASQLRSVPPGALGAVLGSRKPCALAFASPDGSRPWPGRRAGPVASCLTPSTATAENPLFCYTALMTDSPEPGTREWMLQRLRQMAHSQVVDSNAERKIHTAMDPSSGEPAMAYCRDEGIEIIADFTGEGFILQAGGHPVQTLLERATSGDQTATSSARAVGRRSPGQVGRSVRGPRRVWGDAAGPSTGSPGSARVHGPVTRGLARRSQTRPVRPGRHHRSPARALEAEVKPAGCGCRSEPAPAAGLLTLAWLFAPTRRRRR